MSSLGDGFNKGIQHIADAIAFALHAEESGNVEQLAASKHLLKTWWKEATDETTGLIKGNLGIQLLEISMGGHDPFAGSRQEQQSIETKYNFHPHHTKK